MASEMVEHAEGYLGVGLEEAGVDRMGYAYTVLAALGEGNNARLESESP